MLSIQGRLIGGREPPERLNPTLRANLKCLCTKARSLGNKQDELELDMQLQNHDTFGKTDAVEWVVGVQLGYMLQTLQEREEWKKPVGGVPFT